MFILSRELKEVMEQDLQMSKEECFRQLWQNPWNENVFKM